MYYMVLRDHLFILVSKWGKERKGTSQRVGISQQRPLIGAARTVSPIDIHYSPSRPSPPSVQPMKLTSPPSRTPDVLRLGLGSVFQGPLSPHRVLDHAQIDHRFSTFGIFRIAFLSCERVSYFWAMWYWWAVLWHIRPMILAMWGFFLPILAMWAIFFITWESSFFISEIGFYPPNLGLGS